MEIIERLPISATTFTANGLVPGTSYDFTVIPYTAERKA